MYEQIDIFNFIEPILQEDAPTSKPLFDQLFAKIDDPITLCANCLCRYCANNAEEIWDKVHPDEVKNPCFNCDTCSQYDNRKIYKRQDKKDCESFVLSSYGADRNRKKFKII